jgi:glutathione S-transferase
MITIYGGKPMFGLPNPSPFVIKAYILLKMAGLSYDIAEASFRKAPKGKVPYILDDGLLLGDTHFIRKHIEKKYGFDFDKGHGAQALAVATGAERMAEERIYWTIVYERWMIDENFERGPAKFFDAAPAPIRPFVRAMIKRQVKKALWAQGTSRHSYPEILALARTDLNALSEILSGKPWLLGDAPCGADASVVAALMSASGKFFDSGLKKTVDDFPNLVAYAERGRTLYFPEIEQPVR